MALVPDDPAGRFSLEQRAGFPHLPNVVIWGSGPDSWAD